MIEAAESDFIRSAIAGSVGLSAFRFIFCISIMRCVYFAVGA